MRHLIDPQQRQQQLFRLQQRQRELMRAQQLEEDEEQEQSQVEYRLPVIDSWKQPQNNYTFGIDSIELENETSEDDDDDVPGIYEQSNLAEQMLDLEEKYNTSSIHTSFFSSDYFERPALYRVLFMGSTTDDEKTEIFQKLSRGFVYVLHDNQRLFIKKHSQPKPIAPFKEIKHNVILLSDYDEPELASDTYEDIGISLIEADFTWNSSAMNYADEPDQLLLRYASSSIEPEEGFVFPESTPNGIDLCVYFYTGDDHDRVEKDMVLLRTLRKSGIYVLPLTTTRDEHLKSHFADLLTEYKVRCLDLGNLDVGKQPSFFRPMVRNLECTMPRVATYQILAIDQFCAIENRAIFQLLKKTRERRAEVVAQNKLQLPSPPSTTMSETDKETEIESTAIAAKPVVQVPSKPDTPPPTTQQQSPTLTAAAIATSRWYFDYRQFLKSFFIMALVVGSITSLLGHTSKKQWSATFEMNLDYTFTLQTKNPRGNLEWAIQDPQVWLNHDTFIPIAKDGRQRGTYRLTFDVTSIDTISFEFSVNTSLPIHYTMVDPSTYLLINPSISKENRRNTMPRHQEQPQQQEFIQSTVDTLSFFSSNRIFNILKFLVVE